MIPQPKAKSNAALAWIAGLMGRMDKALAEVIPGLAPELPKLPPCLPFHKRKGYEPRPRNSAGGRKKAAAAARRAANVERTNRGVFS